MKLYSFFFLSIALLSCGRVNQSQESISEISHEQKIIQVQKLLAPQEEDSSVTHRQGQADGLNLPWWEYASWKVQSPIEDITHDQNSIEGAQGILQENNEYLSGGEIFTQEEIDLIESVTDAEIDKLIEIIFKE